MCLFLFLCICIFVFICLFSMDKKVMELDRKAMGIIVNEMSIFAWCNGVVVVV